MKLKTKIYLGFLFILLLFSTVTFVKFRLSNKSKKAINWLSQVEDVMRNSAILQKEIIDMETGLRGYLISGNEEFLEPHFEAIENYKKTFGIQKNMLAFLPEKKEDMDEIDRIVVRWQNNFAIPLINAKRIAGDSPEYKKKYEELLLGTAKKGVGKTITDTIRDKFERLDNNINDLKQKKSAELISKTITTDRLSLALNITAILFSLIISVMIVRLIGRRINEMVLLARQISLGDFDIKVTDNSKDELSRLAGSLNLMAETLGDNFDKLEQVNRELERKDAIKNEYVQRVTHDIKGHLAVIQNSLSIVTKQSIMPIDAKNAEFVEMAYRRTLKLTGFVQKLLHLTKMRLSNKFEHEVFSIREVINDAYKTVQPNAESKNIRLELQISNEVNEMDGVRFSIEEIITNLFLNGIKYTPENGTVGLRASIIETHILIAIYDTGVGIPPDEIQHIFEEFYRASNVRKKIKDGDGLGLSLVKQIAERHGGTVSVNSKLDEGSEFVLKIPLRQERST